MGQKGYVYYLIILGALAFSNFSFAKSTCTEHLQSFLFKHENTIFFNDVEIFRQNNNIGPQQMGKINFRKWVDFTLEINSEKADSVVGLTANGQILHLIKFKDRTIARLLNGEIEMVDFKMSKNGDLIALGKNQKTYLYSSYLWEKAPGKTAFKKGVMYWALSTATGVTLKLTVLGTGFGLPMAIGEFQFMFPMFETMLATSAALSSGLAMANKYYYDISYPNGFLAVPLNFKSDREIFKALSGLKGEQTAKINSDHQRHFNPPDFNQLPPRLPKELTEDIHF